MHLLPRDVQFFELFAEVADCSRDGALELVKLFEAVPDLRPPFVESIKDLEHRADELTREVGDRVDRTFITPLDREDILTLASALDNVMDAIDRTARGAGMYPVGVAPQGVTDMVRMVARSTEVLARGVQGLKKGDVNEACIEAKQIEEEGDAAYQRSLRDLFDHEKDPITIMKWKAIYDTLEFTLDQADDVANLLKSITVKHH